VACYRSAIAALAVLFLMPTARRLGTWRTWLVGAVYAATMILFVQANKLTTAANTIFLQSTAPLHILLLSPWLLKEPVRRRDLAFLGALGVGLGLIFLGAQPALITAPRPFLGNVLAAISGLSMALTIMGLRWVARSGEASTGSPASAVVSGNIIAFLVCLPWALPVSSSRIEDWLVLGYLGSFQVGLAYCLVTAALRRVPALEASLLLMLEPVLNPIWVLLVHRERPSGWTLAGGALILAATAVRTWRGIHNRA